MSQKELFNKHNRESLRKKLEKESFNRITCSFYKYVNLDNVNLLRDELYLEWNELNILGRIYLAHEGINAQVSVPEQNWTEFKSKLYGRKSFTDIPFKIAFEDNKMSFNKLIVRIKPQIVADGLSDNTFDTTNVGNHLTANEFNTAMAEKNTVIVDVRNHHESEVGHFEGAICPDVDTFKESLTVIKQLLAGKEENKVLLYCTGGIRCEKTSAYLKHHNFKDVNQLHGGIIDYSHQIKAENLESKFKGKNFVFDGRLGERITKDILSNCHQCDVLADTHTNCANQACHILFIQCEKCAEQFNGCCSEECCEISKLSLDEQKELRKDPKKCAPLLQFKDRVKPKLKELAEQRRKS